MKKTGVEGRRPIPLTVVFVEYAPRRRCFVLAFADPFLGFLVVFEHFAQVVDVVEIGTLLLLVLLRLVGAVRTDGGPRKASTAELGSAHAAFPHVFVPVGWASRFDSKHSCYII